MGDGCPTNCPNTPIVHDLQARLMALEASRVTSEVQSATLLSAVEELRKAVARIETRMDRDDTRRAASEEKKEKDEREGRFWSNPITVNVISTLITSLVSILGIALIWSAINSGAVQVKQVPYQSQPQEYHGGGR